MRTILAEVIFLRQVQQKREQYSLQIYIYRTYGHSCIAFRFQIDP